MKVKKGDSGSPGGVDLVKWKYKWKIGGSIVKVNEEQWSFSSGDMVNTEAKHAKRKLQNECGAIVKVKEEQWLFSSEL